MFKDFFKAIGNFFTSMFKGNKAMLQLTIQALAGEFFKKYPKFKPMVKQVLDDVLAAVEKEAISVEDIKGNILKRINVFTINPAEKALLNVLVESIFVELKNFTFKAELKSMSDQIQITVQVLKWVQDATKF